MKENIHQTTQIIAGVVAADNLSRLSFSNGQKMVVKAENTAR